MRTPLVLAMFIGAVTLFAGCSAAEEGGEGRASMPSGAEASPLDPALAPLEEVFAAPRLLQWKLPNRLKEISGLALTDDGRLFAVADERAEIVELDYRDGAMSKRFRVGDPVLAGDFEGIAAVDDVFYIITSAGTLVRFADGEDRGRVAYQQFDTGLGAVCEIEGLAFERRRRSLLIACKDVLERSRRGEVQLWRWWIDEGRLEATALVLDENELARAVGARRFEPSGIDLTADGGTVLLIAARQRAVARATLTADGGIELIDALPLPERRRHRQAEGIAVLPGGGVLVADEGGNGRGRLGIYGQP